MKRLANAICALILMCASSLCADSGAAFEFGPSVRATSLGDSVVAMTSDVSSVFWNPSGLSMVRSEVQVLRYRSFETDYTAAQFGTHFGQVGVAVGYLGASLGGIPINTRSNGRASVTGQSTDYAASGYYLGVGLPLTDSVSVGVSGKWLQQSMYGASAAGAGADIGAQWRILDGISSGVLIQNVLAPQFKWSTESGAVDDMSTRTVVGVSLDAFRSLTGSSQIVFQSNRPAYVQWGLEWEPWTNLFVRAGHNNRQLSVGTGIKLDSITMDFAWSTALADGVDDTYRLGLGWVL